MLSEVHRALELLEGGFAQVRALVVGDLMLDRYIHGEVDRISPEAPVPVLRHAQRYERAGGAANVAMNLAGLGCEVFLAGFWGEDTERRELERILAAANVDVKGVVATSLPTISKTRIVGRQQQLLRLDIESRDQPSGADITRLAERAEALAAKVSVVILSDYAKGALAVEVCERVIRAARHAGVPVLADPKSPDFSRYTGATTVCPNLHELAMATGFPAHHVDEMMQAAELQRQQYEIEFLTVTMSEKGIRVLDSGGGFHSPARAREVFDVSGAGDTVIATMAAGLAGGLTRRSAVELANLAAGIVVGKVGTVPIAQHELVAALTPSSGVAAIEKLLDADRLEHRVAEWRANGESVVLTNGCFDILHVGHITLLEECKRFGSKLIVALNDDDSVRRVKGAGRPVVGIADRARVMAALAAVDAVTVFEEDSPAVLIGRLRPDVVVKGGTVTDEHNAVAAYGGRVEVVALVEGFSAASLLSR